MADTQKTQPTSADVERFLEELPDDERRADARVLVKTMSELTRQPPVLWGSSIVGFGTYHYRYPSGREGTAPLASFSPRKQHLVVYLLGGFEERHHRLVERLGSYKTGKGCLYLKRLGDVDLEVLRELIKRSIDVHQGMNRQSASP